MGVPLAIIHFHGIFPYKPSSYWDTSILGNLHISLLVVNPHYQYHPNKIPIFHG